MTVGSVRLSDIAVGAQSGFASGESNPDGVLQVRMNNVTTEGAWDWSKERRVPATPQQREKYALAPGDVLVNVTNSPSLVGKSATFPGRVEPVVFSNHFVRLRLDAARAEPDYVRRWLNVQWQRHIFEGLCTQWVNQASVRKEDLLALRVPLPSLPEQRRIAAILDKADAVRRKRQQTLNLADQFLRSAFLDMFGDPVTNPKGWPERRLDSFAEIRGGVTKGRKLDGHPVVTVPYVRVANVQDGFLDLREVKQIEVLDTDVDKYRLLRGDVLLTEGGDPDKLGRGAVWTGEIDPCIHQNHIFSVRVDAHVAEPQYISTLLGSAYGKRYFLRAGKQTTGIATINRTQLCGFPAYLPPVRLQNAYATLVDRFGQSQRHRMLSLNEHDALEGAVIRRAFRGAI